MIFVTGNLKLIALIEIFVANAVVLLTIIGFVMIGCYSWPVRVSDLMC